MPSIEENLANNITKLRKTHGWTQIEFAEKLNYSDKAISKWERADSMPDIKMLNEIAKLFNVNVDYLIQEHSDNEISNIKNDKKLFVRNLMILIMLCVAVFLISTFIFMYSVLKNTDNASKYWVAFVAATPLCSLICAIYAKKEKYWLMQIITCSLIVWTTITTVYCSLITLGQLEFWLLFIIGIPIEAAICLFFFWKRTF